MALLVPRPAHAAHALFFTHVSENVLLEETEKIREGREGVKWAVGFAFLEAGKWDHLCTGTGIHESKKQ